MEDKWKKTSQMKNNYITEHSYENRMGGVKELKMEGIVVDCFSNATQWKMLTRLLAQRLLGRTSRKPHIIRCRGMSMEQIGSMLLLPSCYPI